jgi:hypothetical protein
MFYVRSFTTQSYVTRVPRVMCPTIFMSSASTFYTRRSAFYKRLRCTSSEENAVDAVEGGAVAETAEGNVTDITSVEVDPMEEAIKLAETQLQKQLSVRLYLLIKIFI